ncbi:MAG: diacylglycerol kinase family lipid kinase [Deltaproteobacteria bacterium]|nr:MAG: diacylglycerol kinase family lipid kinase [Deltaproteobacteria bacterium]
MTEPWITIVNPAAGGGRCGKQARDALFHLREAGMRLATVETEGPGDASRIARDAFREGHRRFLSVGGDGTHYEVVNGLFPRPVSGGAEPVLGMLPLGTGNSFLRDFGVTDVRRALMALEQGNERPVDVIRATHKDGVLHYINLLSVGFTAHAGALTNRHFKPFGALGYVFAVLVGVARLGHPRFPVALDDAGPRDERPCTFISFSNSRYTGGTMMMAPEADATDGWLDVIRMGPLRRGELVAAFPRIFKGTHRDMAQFEGARAKRVELALDGPVDVMVDGEVLSVQLESLEVLPGALRVVA